MSSMPQCRVCGKWVNFGPCACDECLTIIEKQRDDLAIYAEQSQTAEARRALSEERILRRDAPSSAIAAMYAKWANQIAGLDDCGYVPNAKQVNEWAFGAWLLASEMEHAIPGAPRKSWAVYSRWEQWEKGRRETEAR